MPNRSYADRFAHATSRALHRLHPKVPVVKTWPGIGRLSAEVFHRVYRPVQRAVTWQMAMLYRRRLNATTFVGVTGSAGKTMTKVLIGSVLSSQLRGGYTRATGNTAYRVGLSVLRHARKGDQYHVVELSGHRPGALAAQLQLALPKVGVVTTIGTDHYKAFGSVDAIAAEKARLVRSLPIDGVAILNADDARVLAMRDVCRCRVITFGVGSEAMVRAQDVSSAWPEPLAFSVACDGAIVRVQTRLYGTQWVSAVLAAIATGIAFGIPLDAAAAAVGRVKPSSGRMSPLVLPEGITFIRDDWKSSGHTIPPALDFLGEARATRKVAIIGTISDTMGNAGKVYVDTARHALDVADTVCFVGPRATSALRARPTDRPDRLHAFTTPKAANRFLSSFLKPGDLILLKGSNLSDHLYRLALARTVPVACWRMDCNRGKFCDQCELLEVPSEHAPVLQNLGQHGEDAQGEAGPQQPFRSGAQLLIGLGNPGDGYRDTPHNVGQAVLDRIAEQIGAKWRVEPDAAIATAEWLGQPIWLVKPIAFVNLSGPALHRLSARAGFRPEHCVLVYDDLDLPLGTVRTRMRGSDGGHRGVRSVLEAFQTDQFRRVKIGVKRAGDMSGAKEAVLRPFAAEDRALVDAALAQAQERLSTLVHSPTSRATSAQG